MPSTQSLPPAAITDITTLLDALRANIAQNTTPDYDIEADPIGFLRRAERAASSAHRIQMLTTLIEDLPTGLERLGRAMDPGHRSHNPMARLNDEMRAEEARAIAQDISIYLTDEQVRVITFGPRNRHVTD